MRCISFGRQGQRGPLRWGNDEGDETFPVALVSRPTARDVAQAAGVSLASVSRAFQPDAPVAAEKRRRILAVAERLGYRSPAARSIERLGTGAVSLIAGDLTNPFYAHAIELLAHGLYERGMRLVLHAIPPGHTADSVMKQVLAYRSDAAILTSATMSSSLVRACREQRMPVILLNRVQPDATMTAVTCDNYGGARRVAQHLLSLGRLRIAHMTGLPDTSTHLERRRGFLDGLGAESAAVFRTIPGHFSHARAYEAASELFSAAVLPDALFCENDIMALAAVDRIRELGLRVPEDVAVIGFDDIQMASWQSYRLTTVRQPIREMIGQTLDLIENLRAGAELGGTIRILPTELILRHTA